MTAPAPDPPPISASRKWAITLTVMVVAFMQILDTSVTNVVLPHLQGSLSAGLDEVSWVITSYLAANAVVIPATGWLVSVFGRKRFFLICCTLFTVSSFISGAAPDLPTLIAARIFGASAAGHHPALAGHSLGDLPFHQRGMAWRCGGQLHPRPDPGADRRQYLADEWSWRWIFYINLGRRPQLPPGHRLPLRLAVQKSAGGSTWGLGRGGGLRVPPARPGSRGRGWFDSW
jgi:DHA2 family multidrug resistance protein